jgi:hypothetical protein
VKFCLDIWTVDVFAVPDKANDGEPTVDAVRCNLLVFLALEWPIPFNHIAGTQGAMWIVEL